MTDSNYIPSFQFGEHTVEAWGHRSATADGSIEMVWSIRVDDAWLGSLSTPVTAAGVEVVKTIKHWITQNLPT